MDFTGKFFRRKSQDEEAIKEVESVESKRSLRSSISEGTSSFFGTVLAKKNGLMSDISSKFETLGRSEDMNMSQSRAQEKREKLRDSHPKNMNSFPANHVNGGNTMQDGEVKVHNANMSFDEPLYQRRGSKESIAEKKDSMEKTERYEAQRAGSDSGASSMTEERAPGDPPFRIRRHSIVEDIETEPPYRRDSIIDDFGFSTEEENDKVPDLPTAEEIQPKPETSKTGERSEVRRIIHAMGDLISFDDDAFERGSVSSQSDYGANPVYDQSPSECSEKSWNSAYSSESLLDEFSAECKEFMARFVDGIFNPRLTISQQEKAKFGEYTQHGPGRLWFARIVNSQRVNNKKVDEEIFYQLVQYFAVVLFECHEAEDFSPAKTLMNMCFTFFYEDVSFRVFNASGHAGVRYKHFLYSYLKDQPIWQSLRFWNAAFFDAVQSERSHKPLCTRKDNREARTTDKEFQENITFGQLGTFTCNMRAFGLQKDLCLEFLRKQSTIANLREGTHAARECREMERVNFLASPCLTMTEKKDLYNQDVICHSKCKAIITIW
ncbi:uncharacterized protein LOC135495987 isoform X2 [Lineus longissimus]|uniref:uncharacterized protein LOC135495987 isoform X2 n=1 Tax=Lineus longissimus TaxID=88925 RepID=UPI00315DE99F